MLTVNVLPTQHDIWVLLRQILGFSNNGNPNGKPNKMYLLVIMLCMEGFDVAKVLQHEGSSFHIMCEDLIVKLMNVL